VNSPSRAARRKERIQLLATGAAVALVIAFAIVNLNQVSVDWIVTTTNTSLTIVIAVSFLIGAVAGAVFWSRRRKR
jgi:uncharacterized integral membrane protein